LLTCVFIAMKYWNLNARAGLQATCICMQQIAAYGPWYICERNNMMDILAGVPAAKEQEGNEEHMWTWMKKSI
jgi:hypothetical protein